jgi:hypothetical protein
MESDTRNSRFIVIREITAITAVGKWAFESQKSANRQMLVVKVAATIRCRGVAGLNYGCRSSNEQSFFSKN